MTDTAVERAPSPDDGPMIGNPSPQQAPQSGRFDPDPNKWYYLKADYQRNGKTVSGYLYPVGPSAVYAFWDYIQMGWKDGGCQLRFKKMDGQMWYTAEVRADGYHLCMKATGWMYRASYYTAGFLIGDDGHLYVDSWSGPLGCSNSYKLMSETYFVGADCDNVLTNCELVEVDGA